VDINVPLREPGRGDGNNLFILAAIIEHLQNADRSDIDDSTWHDRPRIRHQHVDRVAVIG
jgi:hypothetical protein